MTADILELRPKIDEVAQRIPAFLDGGGGPPNNGGMEARVTRLESAVEHMQGDIREIKSDIRSMLKLMISGFVLTWSGIIGLAILMLKGFGWFG